MSKPLVTIGIPVYNEEKYLAETIESAINQTFQDIEIIISDNCSTDKSFEIAKSYAEKDKRIKVIKQDRNIGVHENFCFILDNATTTYFLWLGAHDKLDLGFISEASDTLNNNTDYILLYPKSIFFKNGDKMLDNADADLDTRNLGQVERMYKVVNSIGTATAIHGLFRTQLLQKVGFDKYGSDHLVFLMIAIQGHLVPSNQIGFYRRIVREETLEEREVRYEEFGYKSGFPFLCSMSHLKNIFLSKEIAPFKMKMKFIYDLKFILNKRMCNFSWKQCIGYFVFKEFYPALAFCLVGLCLVAYIKNR